MLIDLAIQPKAKHPNVELLRSEARARLSGIIEREDFTFIYYFISNCDSFHPNSSDFSDDKQSFLTLLRSLQCDFLFSMQRLIREN